MKHARNRIGHEWKHLVSGCPTGKANQFPIALVGKYVELHDAYMSVREALKHAALHLGVELDINGSIRRNWKKASTGMKSTAVDGILVPGGFGSRGIEGKIQAARYARRK